MSPSSRIAGLLRRLWKGTARLFSAPQTTQRRLELDRPRAWSPDAAGDALRQLRGAVDAIPLWLMFDHDRTAASLARVRTSLQLLELMRTSPAFVAGDYPPGAARAIPVIIGELENVRASLETRVQFSRTLAGDSPRLADGFRSPSRVVS